MPGPDNPRETKARVLTSAAVALVLASAMFTVLRADVDTPDGSAVLGLASWGPQLRSGDTHFEEGRDGDLFEDYHGITARASWWSQAVATTSNELAGQRDAIHTGANIGLAKISFVFTFAAALALTAVGLALMAGARPAWFADALGWTGLAAAAGLLVGYALLVWAGIGLAVDFRPAMPTNSITVRPGASAFLQPLGAVAAAGMGWLWLRAASAQRKGATSRAEPPVVSPGAGAALGTDRTNYV